jgi:O-succinylhomoserine sulfhydrylase
LKKETSAIRLQTPKTEYREHSTPLFMTSSFVFDDAEHARALFSEQESGDIYTRYSNPSNQELINKIVQLENAEDGLAQSSGMAAIFSSLAGLLRSGDHIIASRSLFGSTIKILNDILPRWGISSTFVDIDDSEQWTAAVQKNTKILFTETPSNPGLDLCDLTFLGKLKEEHDLILVVDNTFATPVLQNPMNFGADLIAHSSTKFIDGQGRTIGGLIVGKEKWISQIRPFVRNTGPSMSPFNAWLLSKSLETLHLRMERHCDNAMKVAAHFENHDELVQVKYPLLSSHAQHELAKNQMKAGGGIVTMEIKGGLERTMRFINKTTMASRSSNLGDTRTIITHPSTTTHSSLSEKERMSVGITPGLVRISVGLENIEDIIADFETALDRSKK